MNSLEKGVLTLIKSALTGKQFASYWIHNGLIKVNGQKMSKSLGNVVWLKDIIEEYHPNAFRLAILANHYRQVINYQDDMMRQMQGEWEKIEKLYISVFRKLELCDSIEGGKTLELMDNFLNEMAYDFNTSNAITHLYALMKKMNADIRRKDLSIEDLQDEFKTFKDMLYILGINVDIKPLSIEEKEIVLSWQDARNNRDFEKADELRNKINELGIRL